MEWLTLIWLSTMIPFALIGQGVVMFLIIRLIHQRWFVTPDAKDVQIVFLEKQLTELTLEKNKLSNEKDILVGKCIDLAKTS